MKIFASVFSKAIRQQYINPKKAHSLLRRQSSSFSVENRERVLMSTGSLQVRNSQTLVLKLKTINQSSQKVQSMSFSVDASSPLTSIADIFQKNFNAFGTEFLCEKKLPISKFTPIEVFVNRSFTIINPQSGYKIDIEGELLPVKPDQNLSKYKLQLQENLSELELPVIAQRQIEAYFNRVAVWLDAKYGPEFRTEKLKMKEKDVQDILVQAILDPQCNWTILHQLQNQWYSMYLEVRGLRDKKNEALKLSEKMATLKMSYGLGLIAANIGLIWSGTYVFFSWDIIEPIAYFTSSMTSIILFGQILKIKKPFSLQSYREYLINQSLPTACEHIGLNLSDLNSKQMELQMIESTIKDHLIAKL